MSSPNIISGPWSEPPEIIDCDSLPVSARSAVAGFMRLRDRGLLSAADAISHIRAELEIHGRLNPPLRAVKWTPTPSRASLAHTAS